MDESQVFSMFPSLDAAVIRDVMSQLTDPAELVDMLSCLAGEPPPLPPGVDSPPSTTPRGHAAAAAESPTPPSPQPAATGWLPQEAPLATVPPRRPRASSGRPPGQAPFPFRAHFDAHPAQQLPASTVIPSFALPEPHDPHQGGPNPGGDEPRFDPDGDGDVGELEFLLGVFTEIEPSIVKQVFQDLDYNSEHAITKLSDMLCDEHDASAHRAVTDSLTWQDKLDLLATQCPSAVTPTLEATLQRHDEDVDAAIADLLHQQETAGGGYGLGHSDAGGLHIEHLHEATQRKVRFMHSLFAVPPPLDSIVSTLIATNGNIKEAQSILAAIDPTIYRLKGPAGTPAPSPACAC